MKRREPNLPEGDDGRTIVNMNVEGMPWYSPEGAPRARFRPFRRTEGGQQEAQPGEQMNSRQLRMYTWGALKAGLLVASVFCAALVLFVLLCLHVWFRV